MGDTDIRLRARRALLMLAPAVITSRIAARLLRAQVVQGPQPVSGQPPDASNDSGDFQLPSPRKQQDEILRSDYQKNLKEAREVIDLANSFVADLERDRRFVLSVNSLKKLDNMEELIRRIRGRMKRL